MVLCSDVVDCSVVDVEAVMVVGSAVDVSCVVVSVGGAVVVNRDVVVAVFALPVVDSVVVVVGEIVDSGVCVGLAVVVNRVSVVVEQYSMCCCVSSKQNCVVCAAEYDCNSHRFRCCSCRRVC